MAPLDWKKICRGVKSGHARLAGMDCVNHWIPRPSFQTRLYHPALAGTPPEEGNWNHLGGLFQTRLYHGSAELAERPASMQAYIPAGLRLNDGGGIAAFACRGQAQNKHGYSPLRARMRRVSGSFWSILTG